MSLKSGSTLGTYEIMGLLGAGRKMNFAGRNKFAQKLALCPN
jgi:hypothetical protein